MSERSGHVGGLLTTGTDADSANFDGGLLTAFFTTNGQPDNGTKLVGQYIPYPGDGKLYPESLTYSEKLDLK